MHLFIGNTSYDLCSKSIKTEDVFTKTEKLIWRYQQRRRKERTQKWTVNQIIFFKIVRLAFNSFIPMSFSMRCFISLNVLYIIKFYCWEEVFPYIGLYTPIKLFWVVCHLFPQRWRTLTYSVSGNHWPGGPRDILKTTSARKFKSCVFEPPTRRVFSINTSSSNTLVLVYQISSQQQHTPSNVNQQESEATTWMGLAGIENIHWLWDAFQSQRNCPFLIIKKGHFKYVILL